MHQGPTDTLLFMVVSNQLIAYFVRATFSMIFSAREHQGQKFLDFVLQFAK